LLLAISYPAIFVAGGISLAFGPDILRQRPRPARLAFLVYNVVLVASFVSLYFACTVVQAEDMGDHYRRGFWADSFPPLNQPWSIPLWMLDKHAGAMMAYPLGDRRGGSTATLLCLLAGCRGLFRLRRRQVPALLLAPFGLGLLAACLGKYPYGGSPRIMQYLAPSICLLSGLGLALGLVRIPWPSLQRGFYGTFVACLATLGVGLLVRDIRQPYRVLEDVQAREFARWFWEEAARGGEPACLKNDVGLSLDARLWRVGMSAVYQFHQKRFSERHRRREPIDLDPRRYSDERPLRLVVFNDLSTGAPAFDQWMNGLKRSFDLRRTETFVIHPGKPGEDWLRDAYVVLELVPRSGASRVTQGESPAHLSGRRY
jgi:hypothetical protein